MSEVHRGVSWGFKEPVEGGNFIFVHTSECQPQESKTLVVGTRVEYEKRFDTRRSKMRARNVSVRANSGASGQPSYYEGIDQREDNPWKWQRV